MHIYAPNTPSGLCACYVCFRASYICAWTVTPQPDFWFIFCFLIRELYILQIKSISITTKLVIHWMIHYYINRKFNHLYKRKQHFYIMYLGFERASTRETNLKKRNYEHRKREHSDWLIGKVRLDLTSVIQLQSS